MSRSFLERTQRILSTRAAIVGVLGFGASIRFFNLGGKQLWTDEVIQLRRTTLDGLHEIFIGVTQDRGGAPLDYLIQHSVVALFGVTEITARIHAAFLGSLALPLVYLFALRVAGQKVAVRATLLLAVFPLHHHYSQEGRPYALFTFLTVCTFLLLVYSLRYNRLWLWACYAIATTLSFYAAYYSAFVVLSQSVFVLYLYLTAQPVPFFGRDTFTVRHAVDRRLVGRFILAAAVSGMLFVPWIYFAAGSISQYEASPESFGPRLFLRIVKEFSDGSFPLSFLFAVLGGFGLRYLLKEKESAILALLLFWGVLPLMLILSLLWAMDYFFAIRQILFMSPALVMLMAIGTLDEGPSSEKPFAQNIKLWIFWLTIMVSLVVIGLHLRDRRPDFRGTGDYLSKVVQVNDTILAPGGRNALSFYSPDLTDRFRSVTEDLNMECLIQSGNVFIVDSDNLTNTERTLIKSIVDETTFPREQLVAFVGVRVIRLEGTSSAANKVRVGSGCSQTKSGGPIVE